jgi:hypothetical protein
MPTLRGISQAKSGKALPNGNLTSGPVIASEPMLPSGVCRVETEASGLEQSFLEAFLGILGHQYDN